MSIAARRHDGCPTCRCTEPLETFLDPDHRADASLTPADAMRCPEVAKLVEALSWYRGNVSWCNNFGPEGTEARDRLAKDIGSRAETALAPFTKR